MAYHVKNIGYTETADFEIVEFAEKSGDIIITHDLDFGTIMASSGKNKPSIILFRLQPVHLDNYIEILKNTSLI